MVRIRHSAENQVMDGGLTSGLCLREVHTTDMDCQRLLRLEKKGRYTLASKGKGRWPDNVYVECLWRSLSSGKGSTSARMRR